MRYAGRRTAALVGRIVVAYSGQHVRYGLDDLDRWRRDRERQYIG